MHLLFVCHRNCLRTPTAERIFAGVCGMETGSAGDSPDAEEPVSADLIEWADIVFVMEARPPSKPARMFAGPLRGKSSGIHRRRGPLFELRGRTLSGCSFGFKLSSSH